MALILVQTAYYHVILQCNKPRQCSQWQSSQLLRVTFVGNLVVAILPKSDVQVTVDKAAGVNVLLSEVVPSTTRVESGLNSLIPSGVAVGQFML